MYSTNNQPVPVLCTCLVLPSGDSKSIRHLVTFIRAEKEHNSSCDCKLWPVTLTLITDLDCIKLNRMLNIWSKIVWFKSYCPGIGIQTDRHTHTHTHTHQNDCSNGSLKWSITSRDGRHVMRPFRHSVPSYRLNFMNKFRGPKKVYRNILKSHFCKTTLSDFAMFQPVVEFNAIVFV